jgi:hypothetical protein
MFLELRIVIDPAQNSGYAQNCKITYEGDRAEEVSLDADANLITRTALLVIAFSFSKQLLIRCDKICAAMSWTEVVSRRHSCAHHQSYSVRTWLG